MFLLKLGSEPQNLVKKLQCAMEITDCTSTKWNAQGRTPLPYLKIENNPPDFVKIVLIAFICG